MPWFRDRLVAALPARARPRPRHRTAAGPGPRLRAHAVAWFLGTGGVLILRSHAGSGPVANGAGADRARASPARHSCWALRRQPEGDLVAAVVLPRREAAIGLGVSAQLASLGLETEVIRAAALVASWRPQRARAALDHAIRACRLRHVTRTACSSHCTTAGSAGRWQAAPAAARSTSAGARAARLVAAARVFATAAACLVADRAAASARVLVAVWVATAAASRTATGLLAAGVDTTRRNAEC